MEEVQHAFRQTDQTNIINSDWTNCWIVKESPLGHKSVLGVTNYGYC